MRSATSSRTGWGSYSALLDPLTVVRGRGEGVRDTEEEGEGRRMERKDSG